MDDKIITGPNKNAIESGVLSLGVSSDEHRYDFVLRDEGEVGYFIGVRLKKNRKSQFHLT